MDELIWIGNTLYPRMLVYSVVGVTALIVIGFFVYATRD